MEKFIPFYMSSKTHQNEKQAFKIPHFYYVIKSLKKIENDSIKVKSTHCVIPKRLQIQMSCLFFTVVNHSDGDSSVYCLSGL